MVNQIDPSQMTPAAIVNELGDSAENWTLAVEINGGDVLLSVRGQVLPVRGGRRIRKGMVPFVGANHVDPLMALRAGLLALRRTEGSNR